MRSGLLLLDKPSGMTSHDVVSSVRKISAQKQVGHAGTLDPLATGLMVVLMGEATKISDFVLNGDKSYRVRLRLGVTTDSGDADGNITGEKPVAVSVEQVSAAVETLAGEFEWPVPIYSAVKVQGQKLYELARSQKPVEPPKKKMIFKKVVLLKVELPFVEVQLECSKGSFVRTWVEQLGQVLGPGAMVTELRRLTSIPYSLDKAISLEKYRSAQDALGEHFIPLDSTLPEWPQIRLEGVEEKLIKNGQIPHRLGRFLEIEFGQHPQAGVKILSRRNNALIALLTRPNPSQPSYTIKRVFNAQ